jgi:hypothetical protein
MFSYLDIFILDTCLGTNDTPPQHYRLPNYTWNEYRLPLDLTTSSQQLAVTIHLTHSYCTLLLLRFGSFPRLSHWYHDCVTVMNDRNHLRELRNSVYHSAVLESLNSETVHFGTYIDINYFYYLHMRNSFLKLCHVFFKYPVLCFLCKDCFYLQLTFSYKSSWQSFREKKLQILLYSTFKSLEFSKNYCNFDTAMSQFLPLVNTFNISDLTWSLCSLIITFTV